MFLTLNLSQSNRLMVCARGAEYDALDLLVDHACASSVRASPLIAPHQQVFGGGMSEHKSATRTVGAFQSNCFPHFKIEGFQLGSNFQPMFALLKT